MGSGRAATVSWRRGAGRPPLRTPPRLRWRPRPLDCVVWEFKSCYLASAEGDDAADGIVGGNAYSHSISWHYLDSEAAHPAAQLRQHLMPLVALHAIKP